MSVAYDQISFVIQGPVRAELADNVRSIRALFPGAEVVLSTWQGAEPEVEVDLLVISPDPGGTRLHDNPNTNRQLVSTRNGLLAATRPYAVKMRSDCVMVGDGFLRVDVDRPRDPRFAIFRRRIVCPTLFTRNPQFWALLFHPSDMFHFGLCLDLLQLWSAPRVGQFLVNGQLRSNADDLVPEQYLFRSFLQTVGRDLPPPLRQDTDPESAMISNGYLTQNFWVETDEGLGIAYPARSAQPWFHPQSVFTPDEWRVTAEAYRR